MNQISRLTHLILAAAALALALALGVSAVPAFAHDQLVEATPGDGDTVGAAPDAVEMVFSGSPQKVGNQIRVEHDGENVATGEPETQFHTITQSLESELTPGDYTVDWRIVSEDGHPVSGTFFFTVKGTGDEANETESAPQRTDTSAATGPKRSAGSDSSSASDDDGSGSIGLITVSSAVVIVIAAFIVFVVVRTKRSRRHD
ncbi:copper resistance protein CopC [Brevibacterium sp. FME37]|uniref:copper resistance CopC family protein n=1 Tax=Brevibacterium sp. FME37 TaxID=2742607 RepID=UPI00186901ED|nr:copper resistance protein CopC [Brevibacterium sp. FME37]